MKFSILTAICVFGLTVFEAFGATATSEDFEGFPASEGWTLTVGSAALSGAKNHTLGGSSSVSVGNSVAFTTQGAGGITMPIVSGLLDFWYYVDPAADTGFLGEYDALELVLRDDLGAIVSQTWFRKTPGLREYEAGGFISVLPGSGNVSLMNGWNHVRIEFDYGCGIFDLTLNDTYLWSATAFGLSDGMSGTGIISYTWIHQNDNGAELYLDDVSLVQTEECNNVLDCNDVVVRGFAFAGDLNQDCQVNRIDLELLASQWLTCLDPGNCADPTGAPDPISASALPGHYVVSIKGLDKFDKRFGKLGMYTFEADNTIAAKYWMWFLDGSGGVGTYALTDRMIGDGINDPPGNTDEDKYVKSLTRFLGQENNLSSLDGTWSQDGRKVAVDFNDGSWEKWYLSWEEPNNLYKMELYDASYLKVGTNCWLTSAFTTESRDLSAPSGGFAFGGGVNDHNFTFAAPVTALKKDHIGVSISFGTNGASPPADSIFTSAEAGFATQGHWTTNDVVRLTYFGNGYYVYGYYTMPVNNPGILARRTVWQSSHDFDGNGNIESEVGYLVPGLQIVDANGQYRGMVGIQWALNILQSVFWLDTKGTPQSGPSRTDVAQENKFPISMADFVKVANDWLRCNDPLDSACEKNW